MEVYFRCDHEGRSDCDVEGKGRWKDGKGTIRTRFRVREIRHRERNLTRGFDVARNLADIPLMSPLRVGLVCHEFFHMSERDKSTEEER